MNWPGFFLCSAGLASCCSIARAGEARDDRVTIEEFLTAEPTYVQRKGEIELSAAYDCRRPAGGWRVPLLVEYGITDRIEAEVEAGWLTPGDDSRDAGFGDVELGLHYALRPEVERVAVTLGVDIGLPTADAARGPGGGRTEVEVSGIAGVRLGVVELHATGALAIEDEVEPRLDLAALVPRGDLRFTLEANVIRGAGSATESAPGPPLAEGIGGTADEGVWAAVTPGLFHFPRPGVEYGIGVPIGITRATPHWGILGRLTIEF